MNNNRVWGLIYLLAFVWLVVASVAAGQAIAQVFK